MNARRQGRREILQPPLGRTTLSYLWNRVLRTRAEINSHFGASAGRADARRRDEGDVGHRRRAATKPIRALRRRAPLGCGPQARWLCCSLLTYRPGYSSSLAPRQRAWGPAAKWEVISARALST